MTEESDLDDNTVTQHKLPWRSESMFPKYVLSCIYAFYQILFLIFVELNKYIKKLDKKAFGSHKAGGFKSKIRVEANLSTLLPPPNAPKWAISTSCLQMTTHHTTPTSNTSTGQSMTTPTAATTPAAMTTHMALTPQSAVNTPRVVTTPSVASTVSVETTASILPVDAAVPLSSANGHTPTSSRTGSKRRLNMSTSGMSVCSYIMILILY